MRSRPDIRRRAVARCGGGVLGEGGSLSTSPRAGRFGYPAGPQVFRMPCPSPRAYWQRL
jgi:hypothetical protein